MKSNNQVVNLLRAIYLVVVAMGLILIGYVASGGQTNTFCAILVFLGYVLFVGGVTLGITAFPAEKEK